MCIYYRVMRVAVAPWALYMRRLKYIRETGMGLEKKLARNLFLSLSFSLSDLENGPNVDHHVAALRMGG
jgi:hypothetical protein